MNNSRERLMDRLMNLLYDARLKDLVRIQNVPIGKLKRKAKAVGISEREFDSLNDLARQMVAENTEFMLKEWAPFSTEEVESYDLTKQDDEYEDLDEDEIYYLG